MLGSVISHYKGDSNRGAGTPAKVTWFFLGGVAGDRRALLRSGPHLTIEENDNHGQQLVTSRFSEVTGGEYYNARKEMDSRQRHVSNFDRIISD
jgi:hypothetical protein